MKTKKFVSLLLTLCMLLSIVPAMGITASAAASIDPATLKEDFEKDSVVSLAEDTQLSGAVSLSSGEYDLYLNSHTLSNAAFTVGSGVTLNVYGGADKTTVGSGKILSSSTAFTVTGGKLNLNYVDVTAENDNDDAYVYAIELNSGEAIVNGGTLISTGKSDSSLYRGISVGKGKLTINGATVTVPNTEYAIYQYFDEDGSEIVINDGTFSGGIAVNTTATTGKLTINGGTFKGDTAALCVCSAEYLDVTINGGTFDAGIVCSSGHVTVLEGTFSGNPIGGNVSLFSASSGSWKDGWYVITCNAAAIGYTQSGMNGYTSIGTALDAGCYRVMLIKDVEDNPTVSQNNIELDLNGHVIKAASSGSILTVTGSLTITDSNPYAVHRFVASDTAAWTWNDSTGTTVVNGGIITGGTNNNGTSGNINVNSGTLTMKGGTVVGNTAYNGGGIVLTSGNVYLQGGVILGNRGSSNGGGVYINGGTFTMSSGEIAHNSTSGKGGGVYVNGGTFKLEGGSVHDNTTGTTKTSRSGGGIQVNSGSVQMSGGTITGNTAYYGGGVYNKGTFTMTGGSITGNTAVGMGGIASEGALSLKDCSITENASTSTFKSGGVYSCTGTISISGNVVIKGNTTNGAAANFCISTEGGTNYASLSGLGANTEIGVTTMYNDASGAYRFTTNGTADDLKYFFSDSTDYAVKYNSAGYLELVTAYTITEDTCENGSVSVDKSSAYQGDTVTVTATPADGYVLDAVTIKKTSDSSDITTTVSYDATKGTFTMPAYNVTVSATFKQAADPVCYIDANDNSTFDGDDVKYETITAALAATKPATETAEKPTVIRMISDSTENVIIASDRFITLDLAGFVLDANNKSNAIVNYGTLTVKDTATADNTHYFVVQTNGLWKLDKTETADYTFDSVNGLKTADGKATVGIPASGKVIKVSGGCITGGYCTSETLVAPNIYGGGIHSSGQLHICGGNIVGNFSSYNGGGVNISSGSFTMTGGNILGNYISYDGGGVYISSGSFTMTGGSISYNVQNSDDNLAGGVYNHGAFTMYDGSITGNTANGEGGGVYNLGTFTMNGGSITGNVAKSEDYGGGGVDNAGTFTMTAGEISGNTATNFGGGIYSMGTQFEMTGGSITENSAYIAGGVITADELTTLGGTAEIYGNTATQVGNNLTIVAPFALGDGTKVAAPTKGMNVGVTLINVETFAASAGQFTTNGTSDDLQYFFSDDASYGVKYNNEGQYLELAVIPAEVASASYNASLTLDADIDLNFTMGSLGTDGNGTGFEQGKLKITVDGTEMTGYKYESGELSVTLASVAPQNIGKDLHIVITYDGIVIKDFNYSVKAYCDAVFAAYAKDNATYAKLNTLCEALLNYGKWTADYVNKNTDSTINADHEATFGSNYEFTELKEKKKVLGKYAGEGSEAYLVLGSTIKLNFLLKNCTVELTNSDEKTQNFFVLNDENEPKQIDPERVIITKNGSDYLVSIDLYASQLSTSYTLKLKGVDTKDFCITYGVYNYCSDAQSQTDEAFTNTVKTLCKAIHSYSVAVQAYIASTAQ